jgi:acid phosphatase
VATIFYGAHVRPGTYTERISHYSILRTVEDMYGLAHAGASASAAPITNVWK